MSAPLVARIAAAGRGMLGSIGFASLLAVVSSTVSAATTVTVTDIPLARGGSIRIQHYRPDVPLANVYFLAGSDGVFGLPLSDSAPPQLRYRILERGLSVILVDLSLGEAQRRTPEHIDDLLTVLRTVQARDDLPAWFHGFSNGGISVAHLGVNGPRSTPFGLVLKSPKTTGLYGLLTMDLQRIQRPILVLTHADDPCEGTPPANVPEVMSRLSATVDRRHVQFTGGDPGSEAGCFSGYHGLVGLDVPYADEVAGWIRKNASFVQRANYQGLWYAAPAESEPGWGINVTQQGAIVFATWFTYDVDRSGMWLVMPRGMRTADGVYSGELYRTTGPPFSTSPWRAIDFTQVGRATLTFTDSHNGTFEYVVNGVSQSKAITRQVFSQPVPACIAGVPHLASPNYQALWYASPAESERGWGVNVAHQADLIFATWFTYGADGRGMWLVMPEGRRTGAGDTFTGAFYRTAGPAFSASPWNPQQVTFAQVGTGTFSFGDANNGTFSYTVDGVTQSKAITRQAFDVPESICR